MAREELIEGNEQNNSAFTLITLVVTGTEVRRCSVHVISTGLPAIHSQGID